MCIGWCFGRGPKRCKCCGNCNPSAAPLAGGRPCGTNPACPAPPPPPAIHQVVVLDKMDYCATLNNLESVRNLPNFKFIKGDIQSADLIIHVLESEEIDTVMHFAAQTHVDNSFGNSLAFTMNNT